MSLVPDLAAAADPEVAADAQAAGDAKAPADAKAAAGANVAADAQAASGAKAAADARSAAVAAAVRNAAARFEVAIAAGPVTPGDVSAAFGPLRAAFAAHEPHLPHMEREKLVLDAGLPAIGQALAACRARLPRRTAFDLSDAYLPSWHALTARRVSGPPPLHHRRC